MRGGLGGFPTALHKGAASCSTTKGSQPFRAWRLVGEQRPAQPTWPPPSRASVHRGGPCPRATRAWRPPGLGTWEQCGTVTWASPWPSPCWPEAGTVLGPSLILGAQKKGLGAGGPFLFLLLCWARRPPSGCPPPRPGLTDPGRHASWLPSPSCAHPHLLHAPPPAHLATECK